MEIYQIISRCKFLVFCDPARDGRRSLETIELLTLLSLVLTPMAQYIYNLVATTPMLLKICHLIYLVSLVTTLMMLSSDSILLKQTR